MICQADVGRDPDIELLLILANMIALLPKTLIQLNCTASPIDVDPDRKLSRDGSLGIIVYITYKSTKVPS